MGDKSIPEAFPPGEYIRSEMEARDWRQVDLAEVMGVSTHVISQLVNGKRKVTPKTAQALADAFGQEPSEWLGLQNAYDLAKEKLTPSDLRTRKARLWNLVPVGLMIKRGWIVQSHNIEFLEGQIKQLYEIDSFGDRPELKCAARKSDDYGSLSKSQAAWLQRAKFLAKTMFVVKKYDRSRFKELETRIRSLLGEPEEIRHIPKILAEYGIRFLVIEHLPGTKIDGVCFWLDDNSPVIALSMRYNRIDWFWFTLMHELGHVFLEHGKEDSIIDTELVGPDAQRGEGKPLEEREVDSYAEGALIEKLALDDFIARSMGTFYNKSIAAFAGRLNIHPGIVVGRLHHLRKLSWKFGNRMLVNVRDIIIETSLTDGWGYSLEI